MADDSESKRGCGFFLLVVIVGLMALGAIFKTVEMIKYKLDPASRPEAPPPQVTPYPSTPPPLSGPAAKAAEEAALKLYAMQAKGLIQLSIAEPSTFLLVEPLAWRGLTHRDKQKLILMAGTFAHGLNAQGKNILFVICQDLTSRKTLARYSLRDKHLEILR